MAKARAGWERKIYRGTAGSTAATQMDKALDIDVDGDHQRAPTKTRGTSAEIPKMTEQVVGRSASISFGYEFDDGDAHVAALIAAHVAGTPIALKTERVVSGSYTSEFDGDVTVVMSSPGPLEGGMVLTFTCTPTKESGRSWTLA